MCRTPIMLPNGQEVGCRKCDRCISNRVKDWVGRCIAETRTATAAYSVTLTYAPRDGVDRHERTAVLTYSDVQGYLKRLRKHGYNVRFLVAGEFGTLKGRVHWHIILFFLGKVPPHKIWTPQNKQRWWDDFWPWGHQVWQKADMHAVRYVCKYITKDMIDGAKQSKFNMSKVPALGGHYFRELATDYVRQGVAPRGPFYRFPEAKKKTDGKPHEFYMRGATADDFREAFVFNWHRLRPGQHLPTSDFVDEWLDKQVEEWRSSETLEKLEIAAKLREQMEETEGRAEFARKHDLYYFGQHRKGLYDIDWMPNVEEEQDENDEDEFEYIRQLAAEFDAIDQARSEADDARYGAIGEDGKRHIKKRKFRRGL